MPTQTDEDPYVAELFGRLDKQSRPNTAIATPLSEDQRDTAWNQMLDEFTKAIPAEHLKEQARQDYLRNVISPPGSRWDEYMGYWKGFENEAKKPQGDYALSPKQLREKGVKP